MISPGACAQAQFELCTATTQDLRGIAALIVEHSRRPERRCIHSDPRSGVDEAVAELEQLNLIGELVFVVALQQGRLVGCAGAEFDLGLRRAWLRGPFMDCQDETGWMAAAGELLQALERALPAEIVTLDSFLDQQHAWGQRLMEAGAYRRVRLVHVYQAVAQAQPYPVPPGCVEMRLEHAAGVAELHRRLFPNTYLTAEQIVAPAGVSGSAGAPHRVYVYEEDGRVQGYVYGSENLGEGVVDFIGVDENARRRGIGRALLGAILSWMFGAQGLQRASLTVHDELVNARALYEQAGFRLLYTGVHRRKGG